MKLPKHQIALVAHEVNRMYNLSLGDDSVPRWEEAPASQRESVLAGVQAHLDNHTLTPEESHERWSAYKIAEGWTYGEVKDPVEKTHPCLVSYGDLPVEQRTKDYLFKAVVDALR